MVWTLVLQPESEGPALISHAARLLPVGLAASLPRRRGAQSSAYRRSAAARLITRFPIAIEYLRDGRLGVRTLVRYADDCAPRRRGQEAVM